jgi:transposase
MRHRSYSAKERGHIDLKQVLAEGEGRNAVLGVDVSKEELVLVLRWSDERFERPWKLKNPFQIPELIGLVQALRERRELIVALEPTGVYGDALRQALADAGQVVHRVSPKATHDWAEVFDGVPSQHDGKDAAIVAELCGLGKSTVWEHRAASEPEQQLALRVDWMDAQRRLKSIWTGRIEALLARHWPEALRLLSCSSGTLLRSMERWGGPAAMLVDPPRAKRTLKAWGGKMLAERKVDALIESARNTVGVRQGAADQQRMKQHAQQARLASREVARCQRELRSLVADNAVIQTQGVAVGVPTACVLWVCLGDPCDYHCPSAYRKAMGLNLAERSSGRFQGKLKISKRGSALARHWLHLAALRLIRRHPGVQAWYRAKRVRDPQAATRAIPAVTRRLAVALHVTAVRGEVFDPNRLFPGASAALRGQKGESARSSV